MAVEWEWGWVGVTVWVCVGVGRQRVQWTWAGGNTKWKGKKSGKIEWQTGREPGRGEKAKNGPVKETYAMVWLYLLKVGWRERKLVIQSGPCRDPVLYPKIHTVHVTI